jgi:hypothetical protein
MKLWKKLIFGSLFGGVIGFALGMFSIWWYTWQFWVIYLPLTIAFYIFLDTFSKDKKDEDETAE